MNEGIDTEHRDEIVDFEAPTEFGPLPRSVDQASGDETPLEAGADTVEVRRNAAVAAVVGVAAAGVAIAYLARATDSGGLGSWLVCALMALVAVGYLAALLDARVPLLVADAQGVRVRLGRSWTGLTWGALYRVEHRPRRGLRDGRLVLVPRNPARELAELEPGARRSARLTARLLGSPFAVPLALSTRSTGAGADLSATLRRLADGRAEITDQASIAAADEPAPTDDLDDGQTIDDSDEPATGAPECGPGRRWSDPRPTLAHGIGVVAARLRSRSEAPDGPTAEPRKGFALPLVASATPSPLRALISGTRAEVRHDLTAGANALEPELHDRAEDRARGRRLPEELELRRPGAVDLELENESWGDRVRPIAVPGDALETIVIEDFAVEPADDPVIGPEFAAARTRLGLSVDQLAERTRIRPHVIESIEVDDFMPCGGDFYARGHVRTLARVLGVDAAPLLLAYDERYADAPVNPRRVFEAELASSGGIRATRGGPNWSVLVAAVMALVLAWSIARLVMDGPVDLRDEPVLTGSGGPNHRGAPAVPAVPVVVSAPSSGARVIVRDGTGSVIFSGDIAFGATKTLSVSPPVRVQATDGSMTVSVDGEDRGPLGAAGTPGSGTFVVR